MVDVKNKERIFSSGKRFSERFVLAIVEPKELPFYDQMKLAKTAWKTE